LDLFILVLQFLPQDFAESREYYFKIFFSGDWIKFADKQHVIFGFDVSVWYVTNLRQISRTSHQQLASLNSIQRFALCHATNMPQMKMSQQNWSHNVQQSQLLLTQPFILSGSINEE